MKGSKILITLGMIGVLAGGWGVFWSKNIHSYLEYKNLLASAEDSLKDGLYEQAIERYQQSLSYSDDIKTYQKIKEIYDLYYAEEPTAYVRNCYIGDMSAATVAYPKQAEFWQAEIELYMEGKNDSKAYAAAKKALNSGAKSEELTAVYQKLLYEVKLDYQLYTEFKTCLNGYITVCDGDKWQVLDGKGEKVSSQYQFIGLINDEGDGIYTNDIDTLRQMISQSIPQIINSGITIISVFISMLILNIPLTVVTMVMVAVMVLCTKASAGRSGRYFLEQQVNLGKVNGFIEEMMNGQKVVKVFCHEEENKADFKKLNDELFVSADRANTFSNFFVGI